MNPVIVNDNQRNETATNVSHKIPSTESFEFKPRFQLSTEENKLHEITSLSNIIYQPTNAIFPTPLSPAYLHSFRATFNKIICTAHRFQLSVLVLLYDSSVKSISDKVCKIVRSLRKSSVPLAYLKKAFKASKDFRKPLRPLLDVSTRWGSTLKMTKRFI